MVDQLLSFFTWGQKIIRWMIVLGFVICNPSIHPSIHYSSLLSNPEVLLIMPLSFTSPLTKSSLPSDLFTGGRGRWYKEILKALSLSNHTKPTKALYKLLHKNHIKLNYVRFGLNSSLINCYPNQVNKKVIFKLKISVYSLLSTKA